MIFLYPGQIAAWYKSSLQLSGFCNLNSKVKDFWTSCVVSGNQAFPPGFMGKIFEIWLLRSSGNKLDEFIPLKSEQELLSVIKEIPGIEQVTGVFLLSGADRDMTKAILFIEQILERLPPFQNNRIVFSETDLKQALTLDGSEELGFNPVQVIDEMYKSVCNEIKNSGLRFFADDIFEISHPKLFEKPIDRFFHRRMSRAMTGISMWTKSVFSLKEESNWLVSQYGEPDILPLGGYDELTNKGPLSSLVPSELAFIDETMDFDLFDYKFSENQLMYYKRDSGSVFRIRRDIIIDLELTTFFEQERHLGLLFAWLFNFSEKIIDTFVKDKIIIYITLGGFVPSALYDACDFFKHYLNEKGLKEKISINTEKDVLQSQLLLRPNAEIWYFSHKNYKNAKNVQTVFPQTDEFANMSFEEQEMELGHLITELIESMVNYAHC